MRDKDCYCKDLPVRTEYYSGVVHLRNPVHRGESGSRFVDDTAVRTECGRNPVLSDDMMHSPYSSFSLQAVAYRAIQARISGSIIFLILRNQVSLPLPVCRHRFPTLDRALPYRYL